MARIIKDADLNDIIQAYMTGSSIGELAEKYGVQRQSVRVRLVKAGVRTPTVAESKAAHLPPIDLVKLVADYGKGQSVNAIAKAAGVDRGVISRRLLAAGVKLRTQSEQETIKWTQMDPGRRLAQLEAAHEAAKVKLKGRKPSIAAMLGKSEAWEALSRMSYGEREIRLMLTCMGVPHTPQKAVGTYNIDLAINELPIAVEVVCTVPGRRYGPKLREKIKYLLDGGWFVLFVYTLTGNRNNLGRVYSELRSWLDVARSDKSMFSRYGVVRGDSQHGPILRPYLDGLPCVERPGSAVEDPAHDRAR